MPGPGAYWIGEEERREVMEVMTTGHVSRYGKPEDPRFLRKVATLEKEFSDYLGAPHVLATSSGTAALFCSLLAVGLQPGDEVIVPAYTFVATYGAVIYAGLVPVLAEIDTSLNLDPNDIERRLTPRTRAILPVHMLGNPCDMDAILAIAQKHNLKVIEDACQASGASYHGHKVGSLGDMGAFSLNIFKTITCGDGGLIATSSSDYYRRAFAVHDQGHSPLRTGQEVGARNMLGLNFRMTELSGAMALAQFRKLERITATLRAKKAQFKAMINHVPGMKFRKLHDERGECATLLTVIFDDAQRAARIAAELGTKTVDQSGWHVYANMEHMDWYLQHRGLPHGKGAYPQTDDLLSRAINLSVGVVDPGLGAAFGININSTEAEMEATARQFRIACERR